MTAGYSAKILDTTLGVGTLDTMKIVYTVSLLLSGFTMYFFSYKLLKSRKLAFLSGLIYMAIPYHLSDIYVRDAIAETFLFPFLPLILLGVYNLLEGNKKAFYAVYHWLCWWNPITLYDDALLYFLSSYISFDLS